MSAGPDVVTGSGSHTHLVHFYDDDADLQEVAGGYLARAAAAGDAIIVIATPEHRRFLTPEGAVALDASETVAAFTTNGQLDESRFDAVVGDLVRDTVERGRPVTAFGEMVGLLWSSGDVAGALLVEEFWGRLSETVDFELFCGYPSAAAANAGVHADICAAHSIVVGERRFEPVIAGVEAARRFISNRLASWGIRSRRVDDVRLAITELGVDAARRATAPFAVSLARVGHGVRLLVSDDVPEPPAARWPITHSASDSWRWGYRITERGRYVWVEWS